MKARRSVQRIAGRFGGDIGIYVEDVGTREGFGVDADSVYPMASVCKVPLMVTLYRMVERGRLSLGTRITLRARHRVHGSGLFQYMQPGIAPTIRDLVIMMIAVSDNEATDALLKLVSPRAISDEMHSCGLNSIRVDRPIGELITRIRSIYSPIFRGTSYAQQRRIVEADADIFERASKAAVQRAMRRIFDGRDGASPRDMTRLCSMLQRGELATRKSSDDMLAILDMQCFNTGLPRMLPDRASVAHKTGSWDGVANDSGILTFPPSRAGAPKRHIALTVFTRAKNLDAYRARETIGKIGRAVWDALC